MSNCLFCKIISGDIPSAQVYSDEHCIAFKDIHPKAKVHLLVVPRRHIESLAHLQATDAELMGLMTVSLQQIARQNGLDNGFRTVINTGHEGGQEVGHLHFHVMGPV
jgi:histidine triad (HIT) family protein